MRKTPFRVPATALDTGWPIGPRLASGTAAEASHYVPPTWEDGIDKAGVIEILEASGVGLPDYYRWRSRSGCTFCFYQQKIEWVRLMEEHPEAFDEAKAYEKDAIEHGSPFTWSQGESLAANSSFRSRSPRRRGGRRSRGL
jgi:hypothetical protein